MFNNYVLKNWLLGQFLVEIFCWEQIGPSLAPFHSKSLYRQLVLLLDIENTT